MKFDIIDWRITSKCNSACRYCYASDCQPELNLGQENTVISNIKKLQFKVVCVSGGEPLLDPDRAIRIIRKLKRNKLKVFLSTNGTNFLSRQRQLEDNIDKLSLPLDGYNEDTSKQIGRSIESFKSVIEILEYYNSNFHRFPIKISTVLTSVNANQSYFDEMYRFIKKYANAVDIWKIYEIIPEERGAVNYDELRCDQKAIEEFHTYIQTIMEQERDINIQFVKKDERSKAYFIIRPNGQVFVPNHIENTTEEQELGNICEEYFPTQDIATYLETAHYENIGKLRRATKPFNIPTTEEDKSILNALDADPFQKYLTLMTAIREKTGLEITDEKIRQRTLNLWKRGVIRDIIPLLNIARVGLCENTVDFYLSATTDKESDSIGSIISRHDNVAWCIRCLDDQNTMIFRVAIFVESDNRENNVANFINEITNIIQKSSTINVIDTKQVYMLGNHIYKQQYFVDPDMIDHIGTPIAHQNSDANEKLILDNNEKLFLKLIGQCNISTEDIFRSETNLLLSLILDEKKLDVKKIEKRTEQILSAVDSLHEKHLLNRFQLVLDPNMLGFKRYIVHYNISNAHKEEFVEIRDKVIEEIQAEDIIRFITQINYTVNGDWDLAVEIQAQNQCSEIEEKISCLITKHLPDIDMEKHIWKIEEEYKFKHLISIVYKNIFKNCLPRG